MIVCLKYVRKFVKCREENLWFSLVTCEHATHVGQKERMILKQNAVKGRGVKFCSSCCQKDKHHSEESKEKINFALKGEKHPLYGKYGGNSPCFGTRRNEETRKKMSEAKRGERHYRWRHDLTHEERKNEYNRHYDTEAWEWRQLVYKRDNYTCQITDIIGEGLAAHHLMNWSSNPNQRYNIANGITILEDLHILFHKIYGQKHNTPSQFTEFKQYIQKILC